MTHCSNQRSVGGIIVRNLSKRKQINQVSWITLYLLSHMVIQWNMNHFYLQDSHWNMDIDCMQYYLDRYISNHNWNDTPQSWSTCYIEWWNTMIQWFWWNHQVLRRYIHEWLHSNSMKSSLLFQAQQIEKTRKYSRKKLCNFIYILNSNHISSYTA